MKEDIFFAENSQDLHSHEKEIIGHNTVLWAVSSSPNSWDCIGMSLDILSCGLDRFESGQWPNPLKQLHFKWLAGNLKVKKIGAITVRQHL